MVWTTLVYLALAANTPSLPPGKGSDIVQRDCAGCHELKVVTSKRATKEQWAALVDQMVSRGADVPDEDIETVVEYLAKNFGTDKVPPAHSESEHQSQSVNVNKATAVQLADALGLSSKESAAIVSYREQNGAFKEWQDLAKVPGLEMEKIECQKNRIVF